VSALKNTCPAAPSIVITVSPALAGRGNGMAQPPVPMSGIQSGIQEVSRDATPAVAPTSGRRGDGRVHPASSIGF
jgi:hypothetical protein